jgi:hypothetical protein
VPTKSVARPSLENASQLIPPSKSDEEPGKRCALPVNIMVVSGGMNLYYDLR